MKSLIFRSYIQHQDIRDSQSNAALLEECHVIFPTDLFLYTRLSEIKHITLGATSDVAVDGVTTTAHTGASIDTVNKTWDASLNCWKYPVQIVDAPVSGTLGTIYARILGTQDPPAVGS